MGGEPEELDSEPKKSDDEELNIELEINDVLKSLGIE